LFWWLWPPPIPWPADANGNVILTVLTQFCQRRCSGHVQAGVLSILALTTEDVRARVVVIDSVAPGFGDLTRLLQATDRNLRC